MKRSLPIALLFALVLAVPAISEGDEKKPDLATRVEELEKKVTEQAAALKAVDDYMAQQTARRAKLAKAVAASEKKGFLNAGLNTDAKVALLDGLRALSGAKKKTAAK